MVKIVTAEEIQHSSVQKQGGRESHSHSNEVLTSTKIIIIYLVSLHSTTPSSTITTPPPLLLFFKTLHMTPSIWIKSFNEVEFLETYFQILRACFIFVFKLCSVETLFLNFELKINNKTQIQNIEKCHSITLKSFPSTKLSSSQISSSPDFLQVIFLCFL